MCNGVKEEGCNDACEDHGTFDQQRLVRDRVAFLQVGNVGVHRPPQPVAVVPREIHEGEGARYQDSWTEIDQKVGEREVL